MNEFLALAEQVFLPATEGEKVEAARLLENGETSCSLLKMILFLNDNANSETIWGNLHQPFYDVSTTIPLPLGAIIPSTLEDFYKYQHLVKDYVHEVMRRKHGHLKLEYEKRLLMEEESAQIDVEYDRIDKEVILLNSMACPDELGCLQIIDDCEALKKRMKLSDATEEKWMELSWGKHDVDEVSASDNEA